MAQVGLREYVPAAERPQAALAALGVDDDLFESGAVVEVTDSELATVALGAPGVLFERPLCARRRRYTRCS